MKISLASLGVLVLVATFVISLTACGTTPTATPHPPPRTAYICCAGAEQVYVRNSPIMSDKSSTLLYEGTEILVLDVTDGWANISSPVWGYIPPQYWSYTRPSCLIKGNVNFNTGEKIYHVLGQMYYNETVINTSYGERWFCTEAEARANGWRKSSQ